jgi:hypothetical protein
MTTLTLTLALTLILTLILRSAASVMTLWY